MNKPATPTKLIVVVEYGEPEVLFSFGPVPDLE